MAPDLLGLLEQQFSGDVVGHVASAIGEGETATRRAIEWALPAVLGRIVTLGSRPHGAAGLFVVLHEAQLDGARLAPAAAVLASNTQTSELLSLGKPMVGRLFGAHRQALTESLALFAGISLPASGMLLALLIPLIMDVVARQTIESGGFNPRALSRLLAAQGRLLESSHTDTARNGSILGHRRWFDWLTRMWPVFLLLATYWTFWPLAD